MARSIAGTGLTGYNLISIATRVAHRGLEMAARLLKPTKKKTTAKKSGKTSASAGPPAQDRFLRQMIDEHRRVAVFLASGVKLEGEIVSYDQYVILMKGPLTDKVYKHAVSTIQPLDSGPAKPARTVKSGETKTPTIVRRPKPRLLKIGGSRS
jgi:host factor-I protein